MNPHFRTASLSALRILFGIVFLTIAGLNAATITVTDSSDNVSSPVVGSLRAAIISATDGDTIDFDLSVTGTIALAGAELLLDKDITITGPGASVLAISGNEASRIFRIPSGKTVAMSGLTIRDGQAPVGSSVAPAGNGGCILNNGTLALTNSVVRNGKTNAGAANSGANGGGIANFGMLNLNFCTITANQVTPGNYLQENGGANGGGIYNDGVLSIMNSTISSNSFASGFGLGRGCGWGGGIYSTGIGSGSAACTLESCTFSSNSAADSTGVNNPTNGGGSGGLGGALVAYFSGATATNCTFSGNRAGSSTAEDGGSGGAGAIYAYRDLTLVSCTIVGNTTGTGGRRSGASSGGGVVVGLPATIRNTIIADNVAQGKLVNTTFYPGRGHDIYGQFTSGGYNLIGKLDYMARGITSGVSGDIAGSPESAIPSGLAALANNGGPTQTHLPLAGSLAIGMGDNSLTGTDQRGTPRAQGAVDIGAVEVDGASSSLIQVAQSSVTLKT